MIEQPTETVLIGGGALTLLAFLMQYIWRIVARTKVSGHHDRAEIDIIAVLREENKELRTRADMAFKERNAAMEELGALRSEVKALRLQVEYLNGDLERYRTQMNAIMQQKQDWPK